MVARPHKHSAMALAQSKRKISKATLQTYVFEIAVRKVKARGLVRIVVLEIVSYCITHLQVLSTVINNTN